ncbi:glutamine synthetase family protein [Pseudochrobactrum sp. sp1633]|uniref:glutamine synthetase family protein n=1 Tax=Pseudochrobactrum sp. sp1633 TaxID=3036706 RepID=UPI0025A51B81|nr:glutamine synthetase family protein [Pseudochrobactrum sp. sp1633]MDM8346530.1 glutamine synthetase family protein [Pseudochrobactrum sp. sp1633]HWD12747.1 glutamine synthetase family protein [Pseudochrobactrum sp.]
MPVTPTEKKKPRKTVRRGTPAYVKSLRGVKNWKEASEWLAWRDIEDIECITPDQAGVARGKMMPSKKFISNSTLALPSAVFMVTISGDYPDDGHGFVYPEDDGDLRLVADLSTLTVVPWESDPTAQVLCDLVYQDGRVAEFTPRNVLKRVVEEYSKLGLKPVVAPEIEFYLVRKNPDPDYPLTPPVGRSGRAIGGGQGYSIAGVNEFDELIDDIYHFSEAQGLEIDTLIHEEGAGQLEINLRHGDPIELADQAFMFKRTIREAALKHDMYATFMAKPIQGQPGSAMHIHQSIVDKKTGKNIFSNEDGTESEAFYHFIGGMQKHVPNALVMFAPYVNSYRRLTPDASAPVNVKWGYDNRTTALRVPRSEPQARRVENRIPSSDANPYLALAASLACGLIGLKNKIMPDAPVTTSVNRNEVELPRGLIEAVNLFEQDAELKALLGESFATTYAAIKRAEFETFMEVISPWEREYLLLNV